MLLRGGSTCVLFSILYVSDAWSIRGIEVYKVPLRRHHEESVYALAVSSPMSTPQSTNFLATQVWPSARVAAMAVEKFLDPGWVVCELGCGPGLPSLTAAKVGAASVTATDLDLFALELVQNAALQQNLSNLVTTRQFDLVEQGTDLPPADLYILSDVFESNLVAERSARLVRRLLDYSSSRIWVFAQSDRAQREVFRNGLAAQLMLQWTPTDQGPPTDSNIWLCDIDETSVIYG